MRKSVVSALVFLLAGLGSYAQDIDPQVVRAQGLYGSKDYAQAARVIDSAVLTPSGSKSFVAWTFRGFIYYYLYVKADKKLLHSPLRDTVVSSLIRSIRLKPDSDYVDNNNRLIQNLAAHYFNKARELLQDSVDFQRAEYAYNRYKAMLTLSDPSAKADMKDGEYYAAKLSVANDMIQKKWKKNNAVDTADLIFQGEIADKLTGISDKMINAAATETVELTRVKKEADAAVLRQVARLNRAVLLYNYSVMEGQRYQKESVQKEIALGLLNAKNQVTQLELQKKNDNIELLSTTAELTRLQVERQRRGIESLEKEKILQKALVEKQELEANEKEKEISLQRFIRNISFTGIFLLIIILIFIYRSLDKNKKQKKIISDQKQLVVEKHKEITDSINYAERIQRALLANKKMLEAHISDHFILFRPKDVVSGDFYWASALDGGKFLLVTADSTGHGVPGAIMSILNIACLKESVVQGISSVDEILNQTRRLIIENLKHDGTEEGGKDGMDASAVCFDFKNLKLTVAAAYNPVWIVRRNEIFEIAADRMPVGKHTRDQTPFTLNTFDLLKGDLVYCFTDGYADQFGGPDQKKFMHKRLKQLLTSFTNESLAIQKEILDQTFVDWKQDFEQVDDVCVVGVRV